MRRKKLLRQIAAAAVALSMAVSLSAPAFAATFDLSNGGLVITADESGITVKQDGQDGVTSIKDDEEIEITGSYVCSSSESSGSSSGSGSSSDTYRALDAEENLSDPQQQKKSTITPANGELNASAGERQESKAEDEGQPKSEAVASTSASASASASASDDTSNDTSNGPREAQARSSGQGESSGKGERNGIIQIFNNTLDKLVKLTLNNATIDQPNAADTTTRGKAAIDIQGSGDVEIKVEGNNTLNGYGNSAGIQKNDDVSTGKLTITAKDKDQTLNVNADVRGAAIGGNGQGYYEDGTDGSGHGTQKIEINGGTVNTQGRIGSGFYGGAAENIVITGNAVVNANGGIGGGSGESDKDGRTSITISGNAKVTATDKVNTGNNDMSYEGSDADLAVIGGGYGGTAEINISGKAVVKAKAEDRKNRGLTAVGTGAVIGGGAGIYNGKKSSAKVTIEDNAQVTAENSAYGGGAGIGGGANGTGEVIIGGKAQVKATGSAEHYEQYARYGAGAAIGDGGTTAGSSGSVQNGENKFTTDEDSIQDGAKVEMTNIGHNGGLNTVTQTRQDNKWVTKGEQTPEKCKHLEKYVVKSIQPNCTETGSKTYRCNSCGEFLKEEIPVNPDRHDYHTVTVPATCTEEGYTVTKCSRCGEEEGERTNLVAPLGHEYKNGVCTRCGAPEPQENGSAAPNYTVTGAETYETSVVDGRYIIAVPSEDAALNAVLGDLRAIKAQGADVVVFRTRSRESSLVIDEMLAMGPDATPFVLAHNGSEARLTINGAVHNELIH